MCLKWVQLLSNVWVQIGFKRVQRGQNELFREVNVFEVFDPNGSKMGSTSIKCMGSNWVQKGSKRVKMGCFVKFKMGSIWVQMGIQRIEIGSIQVQT